MPRKFPETYTKGDSVLAKKVVEFRKKDQAAGQEMMDMHKKREQEATPEGKYKIKKDRVYNPMQRNKYEFDKLRATTDTTFNKALRDVKADKMTPSPMDRDVQKAKEIVQRDSLLKALQRKDAQQKSKITFKTKK